MARKKRRALITGVTGQDGSYLAELLLRKGYEVYGLVRRVSSGLPEVVEDMYLTKGVRLIDGNLRDLATVRAAMEAAKPDEVYNLAAQSHVGVSFKCPDETWEINYYGVGRVVNEALRVNKHVHIYQASTSEMFGSTPPPQKETSLMRPVSPYGEAKLKAHRDFIVGIRERERAFACSGILFNHESPRRGKMFVTRKITLALSRIKLGLQKELELGNLNARRDWGFAGDYVEAMHVMLQQHQPTDYVIATGEDHSVREFVEAAAGVLGMRITWSGKGVREVGKDASGNIVVKVNPTFYRPHEVEHLMGDASKARKILGWKPSVSFTGLVEMMTRADYDALQGKKVRAT